MTSSGAHHRHNGSDHPVEKQQEFWLGDSRGRSEGDTLVVDVADFNPETWRDGAGTFHGEQLHVVERWQLGRPGDDLVRGDA